MKLRLVTYNMHKGKSFWLRDYRIESIKDNIANLNPDIVFFQEIPGIHPKSFVNSLCPLSFLAHSQWRHHCYGKNAVYPKGHHGNAIASKFDIQSYENHDISRTSMAKRGLLHARLQVTIDHQQIPLHLLNVHLDLTASARRQQADFILQYAKHHIPPQDKIILAGDWNDWQRKLDKSLLTYFDRIQCDSNGNTLRTFPALLPIYDLDRAYTRNIQVHHAQVARSKTWLRLSDHLPLCLDIEL